MREETYLGLCAPCLQHIKQLLTIKQGATFVAMNTFKSEDSKILDMCDSGFS